MPPPPPDFLSSYGPALHLPITIWLAVGICVVEMWGNSIGFKSAKINMKWGLAIKRYVVARLATTYLLIRNVCYVFIENELRTAYALTLIHQSTWLQANLYLRDNEKKILRSWKLVHLQYILSWIYLHLRSCSKQFMRFMMPLAEIHLPWNKRNMSSFFICSTFSAYSW